jgi:hypothetical protein
MPVGEILRGDAALEEYLGLPRGALAKRRLQHRPVPPGIRLPQAKSRFYVLDDVMAWLRAHRERDYSDEQGTRVAGSAASARPDPVAPPRRPRGRPRKGTRP